MIEQKDNDDEYRMPNEVKDKSTVTLTIRLTPKLLLDYTTLCDKKETNRSKRLRNFMIYELKKAKEIEALKILEDEKKLQETKDQAENIDDESKLDTTFSKQNDVFEKPKGLNSGDFNN